jgi:hypothetical protein
MKSQSASSHTQPGVEITRLACYQLFVGEGGISNRHRATLFSCLVAAWKGAGRAHHADYGAPRRGPGQRSPRPAQPLGGIGGPTFCCP